MNVLSLRVRCAKCEAEDDLSQIAGGDGSCRFCALKFCDHDNLQFRLEAYRADVAYRLLVRSLQKIADLSASIRVLPEPLHEVLAEVLAGRCCDDETKGEGWRCPTTFELPDPTT